MRLDRRVVAAVPIKLARLLLYVLLPIHTQTSYENGEENHGPFITKDDGEDTESQ